MKFDPEKESRRFAVKEGICSFLILNAEETKSKAGNQMIKLTVEITDKEGRYCIVFDYLVANAQWKIKNLCESIGEIETYESGEISADMLKNKYSECEVITEEDPSNQYPPKLKIKKYLKRDEDKSADAEIDDDIPF